MSAFDFSSIPTLETERLRLRPLREADLPVWLAILSNDDVRRFLVDIEGPDMNEMRSIWDWMQRMIREQSGIRWAITHKPGDTMIGSCGFHAFSKVNRRVEIGYELDRPHWRQGIMREAVSAVMDFCWDQLEVHRIEADVTVGNGASAGLLKSLGFTHEGTWRERVHANGKFYSLWQFGILRSERPGTSQ